MLYFLIQYYRKKSKKGDENIWCKKQLSKKKKKTDKEKRMKGYQLVYLVNTYQQESNVYLVISSRLYILVLFIYSIINLFN